jgi:hypothetical protein
MAVVLACTVGMVLRGWKERTERWTGCARRLRCRGGRRRSAGWTGAAARRCWSSPESGGAWARRGESEGGRGGLGKMGKMDEGSTGMPFYGLGKAGSRPDVAESAGEVGRRRGVVEGLTGADFRGESGGKVEEVEGIDSTRSWGGVKRGNRGVVGRNRRPWRPLGRREVGEEDDRWGLGSHLSGRERGKRAREVKQT